MVAAATAPFVPFLASFGRKAEAKLYYYLRKTDRGLVVESDVTNTGHLRPGFIRNCPEVVGYPTDAQIASYKREFHGLENKMALHG